MTVTFPAGFKSTDLINEMYPEVERLMRKQIDWKSKRIASWVPYIDFDDAVQEGRLALLSAIAKFDFNKNKGSLKSYVGKVLVNTYHCMLYEALTKSRVPHIMVQDDEGNWVNKPMFPTSFDAMLNPSEDGPAPFEPASIDMLQDQDVATVGKLKMQMLNTLGEFEREVFICKVNPPIEFLTTLQNEGINLKPKADGCDLMAADLGCDGVYEITSDMIGRYLGRDKNSVDWAMHKVKKLFTKLAKYDDDFSELFEDDVKDKGWPMIHTTRGHAPDVGFKQTIINKRKLDARPNKRYYQDEDHDQTAGDIGEDELPYWGRYIERYAWGSYVVLKRGNEFVTMIIEGRFNPLTGEVFGDDGMREDVPVSWYKALAKELKHG